MSDLEASLYDRLASRPITGAVRAVSSGAYHAAIAEYVDRVTRLGTARGVYQIGSIGVPGLSDIDLIVVLRDHGRDTVDRYGIRHLSPAARYAFSHDPLLTNAEVFENLPLWFPAKAARHVHGDVLPMDTGSAADGVITAAHVAQMLLCYQMQLFRLFAFGPMLRERVAENLVKGFCNTVALWESVAPSNGRSSWARFAAEYLQFRPSWFECDEASRRRHFRRFLATAAVRTTELIDNVAAHLTTWFGDDPARRDVEIRMGTDCVRFTAAWSSEAAVVRAVDGGELQFPAVFGTFMRAYGEGEGALGRHVRRVFPSTPAVRFRDPQVAAVIFRHRQALDELIAFHRTKFRTSANPFVTFWAPHHSLRIVRLFDRLCNRARRLAYEGRLISEPVF